jgi:hypothetical protein
VPQQGQLSTGDFSALFKEFKFFGGKASFHLMIIEVEEERVVVCLDNKREP